MLQKLFRPTESRRARRLQVGSAAGLLAAGIVAGAVMLGVLNPYGARFTDLFYRPRQTTSPIVLVAIDDKTVEEFDWPIERVSQAAFLFTLARAQPRVIALNFFLPDPANRDEDVFFTQILERANNVIMPVLGIEVTRFTQLANQYPAFDAILKPAPTLRTPNTTFAHGMIYPDPDGVTRRIPLFIDSSNQRFPSVALAAWTLFQGREPKLEMRGGQIFFEDHPLPLDSQGQVLINFVNRDAITRVSYIDASRGRLDPSVFRGKIVLVGPIARVVHETYNPPLGVGGAPMYNIEVQAQMLDTLLSRNFLREQETSSRLFMIVLMGLLAGITVIHFHRISAAALALVYLGTYLAIAFWQFDYGLVMMPLDVALVLVLTLLMTMTYRYLAEERTRAFIARIFLGSVAPEAVDEVLAQYDRGGFSLSGGRRDVSVLSVTLRGITPMSEASAPETVIQVMNQYSARIFEIVFRNGGSVHSQVANTIIAMWNLPLVHPDYAQRAVRAAFEIQADLSAPNPLPLGETGVEAGLGIATGPVVVGHLPVSQRAEYSVIGDVVNVAERLSILATQNRVIVDTPTRDQAGAAFEAEPAQAIRLRGKKDAVATWILRRRLTAAEITARR